MRAFLSVVILVVLPSFASAQRLVEGVNVIYREGTNDYEFRVRFDYDVEANSDPDVGVAFWIYGARPLDGRLDTLARLADLGLHDATPPLLRTTQIQNYDFSAEQPLFLHGNVASVIVPRSDIVSAGSSIDLLFPYHVSAATSDELRSWSYGVGNPPRAQLNVPEPSTLVLAVGSVLLVVPLVRLQFRYRRARAMA